MAEHARLSASGAKKWLNCPLSVLMESQFPNESSKYAEEGTTAHALGELKIRFENKELNKKEFSSALKELEESEFLNEEMVEYINGYRDFVIERFNEARKKTKDAVLMLEQKLDFSDYVSDGFGTGDVVIIADGNMEIIDLKYGKGVLVSAENNPQLRLYALGAIGEYDYMYDINSVNVTIYQPRIDNISSENIAVDKLLKWGEEVVKPKAKLAYEGQGECCAGKHCDEGFCRARVICKAYADKQLELAKYEFKSRYILNEADISNVLSSVDKLVSWAKDIKDYALEQALTNGTKYPGFKLVEGRSNRTYTTEQEVIEVLKQNLYDDNDIYNVKVKGITELEKILGKKEFEHLLGQYVIKPAGKPTLVPESDKRPELNTATEDFKDIINN